MKSKLLQKKSMAVTSQVRWSTASTKTSKIRPRPGGGLGPDLIELIRRLTPRPARTFLVSRRTVADQPGAKRSEHSYDEELVTPTATVSLTRSSWARQSHLSIRPKSVCTPVLMHALPLSCCPTACPDRPLQLRLSSNRTKAAFRFEMSGCMRGMTPTSMLAGRVLYGFYGLFAGVLRITRGIVHGPFYLVSLAFGFKFLVAGDVPSNFFNLACGLICCSLDVFVVHVTPLRS
ncbi:MAG: hypothetical protein QOH35_5496 [Acidobacteriaceae bacterium]|jgi:hypothetical protein|nr:hypothetical protein [Acidobacteriaceae bacterium]